AIDGWVIYVMLILSTLFILLIACVGYQPVPAQRAFPAIVGHFRPVYDDRNHSAIAAQRTFGLSWNLKDVTALNEASQPQEADYKLRLEVADSGNYYGPIKDDP